MSAPLARIAAGALAAAALALPLASAAEVLVVTQGAVPQYAEVLAGFRDVRAAEPVEAGDEAALAAALARKPAVVVAVGSKALEVARARAAGHRVIAAAVLAPEPAPELAAVPLESRPADALRVLAALAPRARRVLALHPAGGRAALAEARSAAKASGLEVTFQELGDLSDFQARFRALAAGHDAIWLLPDPRLAKPEVVKFMVSTCLEHRRPLVGFLEGMTRTGALASVSADFRAIGREAARLAGELEARGPEARGAGPFRFVPGHLSVNARVRELLQLAGPPVEGAEIVR